MLSWSELSPASTSINKAIVEVDGILERYKKLPITDISYDKNVEAPKGEGDLTIPYSYDLYKELKNYSTFTLKVGWVYLDGTTNIKEVAYGIFNDITHNSDEISIPFTDYGVLLEQSASLSFVQMKRSEIMRAIVEKCGLIPIIDFTGVNDDILDYTTVSSSGGGDGEGVCIEGFGSCGRCSYAPKEKHCFVNKCASPTCGKEGVLKISTKPGVGNAGNQITCSACEADYCAKDGWELSGNFMYRLEEVGASSSTSGSTNTSSTPLDSSSSSSDGKTYWDMLMELIDPIGHDLQVIQWLDRVYIQKVPSPDTAILRMDSRYNIIKGSVRVSEGKPFVVNTVVVNYTKDKIPSQYIAYDKRLRDKFGPNIKQVDRFDLGPEEAKNLAYSELGREQRDNEFSIECEVIGHPEWYIGRWSTFNIPKFNYEDFYYITSFGLTKSANDTILNTVTLNEYYPNLEQKDSTDGGVFNLGTVNGVLKAASKFDYCGACQTGECMDKTGCGDCWAMSDWIYKKLTMSGIKARIVQYITSSSPRHRSVQVLQNGVWTDVPYKENGVSMLFRATRSKPGMFVYRGG